MSNEAPTLPENSPESGATADLIGRLAAETTPVFRLGARRAQGIGKGLVTPLIGVVALLLLTYGAMLIGIRFANPHLQLLASADASNSALNGFYPVYCDTSDCYRWSPAQAAILIAGLDCTSTALDLRLAAIRPIGMTQPTLALSVPGYRLGALPVRSDWRHYHTLMPCGTTSDFELQLQSDTFQPGDHDRRQLGVAFSGLDAWPVDGNRLPRTPRMIFLMALPLLGALLIGLGGGRLHGMIAGGSALAGVAGWATAAPVLSAYVLPTADLHQTPWLPLIALLAAPLVIRRIYGALPGLPWSGCALIVTALVTLRLGREVAFGLTTLLLCTLVVIARGQAARRTSTTAAAALEPRARAANLRSVPLLPALTGLRFFAAFAVVLYHYQNFLPHPILLNPLFEQGAASVGLFFVLSGFILTYTYTAWFTQDLTRFWIYLRARFARIFPIYALALVLGTLPTLALIRIYTVPQPSATELELSWFMNLFLISDYVPFKLLDTGWSLPAWSIARECIFYLIFPFFILYGLQRIRRTRTLVVLAITCYGLEALAFALSVVLCRWFFPDPEAFTAAAVRYVYQSPAVRIWEFLVGGILGTIFLRTRAGGGLPASGGWLQNMWVRNAMLGVALLLTLLVAMMPVPDGPAGQLLQFARWYLAYTPGFALLVVALAWGPTFLSALLSHRWVVRLGEASYALFLIHDIPHYILPSYIARNDSRMPWIVLAILAACIVASLGLYRFVETPARRWLREG
jgi:peptidoglycan/LPS O-acetylase OafA/YrhL